VVTYNLEPPNSYRW